LLFLIGYMIILPKGFALAQGGHGGPEGRQPVGSAPMSLCR